MQRHICYFVSLFWADMLCALYTAASLVEPHPGRGRLLATVADYYPAGDSVALHHFAHACAGLPHVSPRTIPLYVNGSSHS